MKLNLYFIVLSVILPAVICSSLHAANAPATQPTTQPAKKYKVTYRLSKDPDKWPEDKRKRIVEAMDAAVALYNEVGEFDKAVIANWNPGTPTADANWDGWMNFGGSINKRVALHELGHCMGIGTYRNWRNMIKDGIWQGEHANKLLKEFDGPDAVLHADRQHFWPYGLNFDKESSPENDIRHVRMVQAMRLDMGIKNGDKK